MTSTPTTTATPVRTDPPAQWEGAPVAVAAEHATKVYGSGETAVRALDEISVALPGGRFTAVMGPSGSGKSTLMHCMAGLDGVTSGRIVLDGVDLGTLSDTELTHLRRDRLGFVFQSFNLLPMLSAIDNITLPRRLAGRAPDADWLDAVIETVGLRSRLDHRPAELSGGQQQRVAVARALAGRPHVIFADEPTGNLDSRTAGEILDFMRRAVDDLGRTVVMVTHDAGAAAYADDVVFLADGAIVDFMDRPTAPRVLERMKTFGS